MATYNFKKDGSVNRLDSVTLTALRSRKDVDDYLCFGLRAYARIQHPNAFQQDADLTSVWYAGGPNAAQSLVDKWLAMPGARKRDGTYKPWFTYRQPPSSGVVAALAVRGLRVSGSNALVAIPVTKARPTTTKAASTVRKAARSSSKAVAVIGDTPALPAPESV